MSDFHVLTMGAAGRPHVLMRSCWCEPELGSQTSAGRLVLHRAQFTPSSESPAATGARPTTDGVSTVGSPPPL